MLRRGPLFDAGATSGGHMARLLHASEDLIKSLVVLRRNGTHDFVPVLKCQAIVRSSQTQKFASNQAHILLSELTETSSFVEKRERSCNEPPHNMSSIGESHCLFAIGDLQPQNGCMTPSPRACASPCDHRPISLLPSVRAVASSGHVFSLNRRLLAPTHARILERMLHTSRTRAYTSMIDMEGDSCVSEPVEMAREDRSSDEKADRILELLKEWGPNTPEALEKLGLQLDPFIMCRVLKKRVKAEAAWEFFKWAKHQENYDHNVYTYTAMINLLGKGKMYSEIETVVAEMAEVGCAMTVVTYTALMHWYHHAKNLEAVRQVWQNMQQQGIKPNVVTYTTFINALVKGGCHRAAMDIYKQMQESGCPPNIFTYTVLIYSLVQAGKLDAATDIFETLGELRCRPSCITYSLLIGAHAKAGNADKSLSIYKIMRDTRLKSSYEMRNSVARALRAAGRESEAEKVLSDRDSAVVAGLELTSTSTNNGGSKSLNTGGQLREHVTTNKTATGDSMISPEDLNKSVPLPKPEKLAEMLQAGGPDMDNVLELVKLRLKAPYVMNVLKQLRKEPDVAWKFYKWAKAQEGYNHTQYTYTKMLDILGQAAKRGNPELMGEMLAEVEQEDNANTVTYNAIIRWYSSTNSTAAALQVFGQMKERAGCEPNEVTYTMLVDLLSRTRKLDQAMAMYGQMQLANCTPSVQTFTVLIHSLAKSGKVKEAQTQFDEMPSMGCPPNVVHYTALMQAYAKRGDIDNTLKLYESMRGAGIKPTRITLKVVAKGLRGAGRSDEADNLSLYMPYLQDSMLKEEDPTGIARAQKAVGDIISRNLPEIDSMQALVHTPT